MTAIFCCQHGIKSMAAERFKNTWVPVCVSHRLNILALLVPLGWCYTVIHSDWLMCFDWRDCPQIFVFPWLLWLVGWLWSACVLLLSACSFHVNYGWMQYTWQPKKIVKSCSFLQSSPGLGHHIRTRAVTSLYIEKKKICLPDIAVIML